MSTLDPSSLKVTELRAELSRRSLPTKGKKDELIARLKEAIQSEDENACNEATENTTEGPAEESTEDPEVPPIVEEKHEDNNKEKAAEKVVEKLAEEILEKPVEEVSEKPIEEVNDKPVEEVVEKPAEVIVEKPTEEVIETPKEEITEKSTNEIIEKPVEENVETPKEEIIENPKGEIIVELKEKAVKAMQAEEMETDKSNKRKLSAEDSDRTEEKRSKVEEATGCTALYVKGFVRPLISRTVQELFGKYGNVKRFWMDFIKTHSYVIYETGEEANKAYDNINGIIFPQDTGKTLTAGKLTLEQAEKLIEYEQHAAQNHLRIEWEPLLEKVKAGESLPQSPGSGSNVRVARSIGMGQIAKQLAQAAEPTSNASRQITLTTTAPPVPKERSLDDLFRKTKALPHLYYLPVSDEEAKIKLNSIKN